MLNSNHLKCIAIICMIIDHIGYFFYKELGYSTYIIFRSIGRIAMPLFVFMLVEGFFYTKNLKKYILRISIFAIVTQSIIYIFKAIDNKYFNDVIPELTNLNILFSFTLILILLRMLDRRLLKNKICDIIFRGLSIATIFCIYMIVKIDYGIYGALIALLFYIIRRYFKNANILVIGIIEMFFVTLFSLLAVKEIFGIFVIYSILFIVLYNGKKGKKSKLLSTVFYSIFPVHFIIIYILRLFI